MTSTVIITLAVVVAIIWLAVLGVSALRTRGPEELAANLRPGTTDDQLETRRLERVQQAAVLLSAFLAIGIPLYYLGETQRQDGFVEQFGDESVERGRHLWQEFGCFNCHGADAVGGSAAFSEPRSGASVTWAAPSLNDIFFRYEDEQVNYWITYGRPNTPMPAWGLAGSGPMTVNQVQDLVNYLASIQVTQVDAATEVETSISAELASLGSVGQGMDQVILSQRQLVAELNRAPELSPVLADLAIRADDLSDHLADLGTGLDTDGDGVSDDAEAAVNDLTAEAKRALLLPGLEELTFAPDNAITNELPDAEVAAEVLAGLRALIDDGRAPVLTPMADAIEAAITSTEGEDQDGDGLTDQSEAAITGQLQAAVAAVLPSELVVASLDPANPETITEQSDRTTANEALSALGNIAQGVALSAENLDSLVPPAQATLDYLVTAAETQAWGFNFETIADQTYDGDVARAERTVGIFQAYCARCHTSGYSAGLPFAQPAGSGALGPALWQGREQIQFLSDEDLGKFLIVGGVPNKPYGVNGVGSGRMPGFGEILSEEDLMALAHWLRSGDLTGVGGLTGEGEG